jgi:hypothetical protein
MAGWIEPLAVQNGSEKVDRASVMFGKRLNIAHQHRQWMIDAGFEDVSEMIRKVWVSAGPQ